MIVALALAAAAAQMSVLDAERAFAKLAREKGQWTAFRATAAPDAVMFVPQPVDAQNWLKDKRDPTKSVRWWPTKAWQSCDGTLAVTTGGALWPDGRHGWFTTVWKRQADGGWKWVLDHGGDPKEPQTKVSRVATSVAECSMVGYPGPALDGDGLQGGSPDGTLTWQVYTKADHHRVLRVRFLSTVDRFYGLESGHRWSEVLNDPMPSVQ